MHYVRKVFPLSIELDNNRDTNLLSNMSVVYLLTLLKASKGGRGAGFTYWLLGESEHNFQQKTCSDLRIVLFIDLPIFVYIPDYVNKTLGHADSVKYRPLS